MGKFKGTKGKWFIEVPEDTNGFIYVRSDYDDDKRLSLTIYDLSQKKGTVNEKTRANALLVSKSPEMLEMLNRVHGEIMRNDGVLDVQKWGDSIEKKIKEATEL